MNIPKPALWAIALLFAAMLAAVAVESRRRIDAPAGGTRERTDELRRQIDAQ